VQFVTRVRGWLLAVQPTAPIENLEATTDGGSSWQVVASSRQAPGIGLLPELGQVEFGADGSGWLGGGMFSNALYRTGDGGRTWRRARIPAPSGSMFGLPAAYGSTDIERPRLCDQHWRENVAADRRRRGSRCPRGQAEELNRRQYQRSSFRSNQWCA
jgi:hypothetical protein